MKYTIKIFKGAELVEQQECCSAEAMIDIFKVANEVYNGCIIEVWRDEINLMHRGLIDFPKGEEK